MNAIEYDPNRSAFIALLFYADGEKRYILAPLGLKVGDTVISSENADIKPGNALPIANIPVGTLIHNLELKPGRGGQLVRSAGMSAQLMANRDLALLVPAGVLLQGLHQALFRSLLGDLLRPSPLRPSSRCRRGSRS